MSLKASCFAVKQQFYGHFLATRIFHLATEKKISVATWRSHKKVIFGPWSKGKDKPKLEFPEGWGVQTQNKTSVGWGGEYGYFLEQHNLTCHV